MSLRRLAERHPVIGDVRGGHGLFAVLELVADRDTREPLAPWPQTPPPLAALLQAALDEGVSFGARGNLILVAPPLVIDEQRPGRCTGAAGSPAGALLPRLNPIESSLP